VPVAAPALELVAAVVVVLPVVVLVVAAVEPLVEAPPSPPDPMLPSSSPVGVKRPRSSKFVHPWRQALPM
jgi:hypothetical protein